MDLIEIHPQFNLYNFRWPIRTGATHDPPAKFVFRDEAQARVGIATDSMVSHGCIISGGRIHRSVLGVGCRVNSFSEVEESVLFERVRVGRHAKIRRAIIDKDVEIPPGTVIGFDREADRQRFFVTDERDRRHPQARQARRRLSVCGRATQAHDVPHGHRRRCARLRGELEQLLDKVRFQPRADRLVLVGDLVVRGPDPHGALALVKRLGARAVRGNHEDRLSRRARRRARAARSRPCAVASAPLGETTGARSRRCPSGSTCPSTAPHRPRGRRARASPSSPPSRRRSCNAHARRARPVEPDAKSATLWGAATDGPRTSSSGTTPARSRSCTPGPRGSTPAASTAEGSPRWCSTGASRCRGGERVKSLLRSVPAARRYHGCTAPAGEGSKGPPLERALRPHRAAARSRSRAAASSDLGPAFGGSSSAVWVERGGGTATSASTAPCRSTWARARP